MKQRRNVFVLAVTMSLIFSLPHIELVQKQTGIAAIARADTIKSLMFGYVEKNGDLAFDAEVDIGFGTRSMIERLKVKGLQTNERLIGAEKKRCSNGSCPIIGVSNLGRIYEVEEDISFTFATASRIGNIELPLSEGSEGVSITIDNEDTCELQVIDSKGKNFFVNPMTKNTSQVNDLNVDAAAKFEDGEEEDFIRSPNLNSVNADNDLTYYIDSKTDSLFSSKIPGLGNAGLEKVGDLGMDITSSAGMDFDSQGNLFAALTREGESHSNLYQIDLLTGQPTLVAELDTVLESLTIIEGLSVSIVDPPSARIPFSSTDQRTFTATLIGADGTPLADTAVSIGVEGLNNFTAQDVTDGEGKVTLTYKNDSLQAGTDTIKVSTEAVAGFIAFPATIVWSAGPFINNIKIKNGGKKIVLTGLQFKPDDQVFINGQQIPTNLVKFKGEGNIVLKLKNRKGEFLNACVGAGSSNTLTIVNAEGETEEAPFIACP